MDILEFRRHFSEASENILWRFNAVQRFVHDEVGQMLIERYPTAHSAPMKTFDNNYLGCESSEVLPSDPHYDSVLITSQGHSVLCKR